MKTDPKKSILEQLKDDEALRKDVIYELARKYPSEFLSRVRIEPGKVADALKGVVVSCKEWQE